MGPSSRAARSALLASLALTLSGALAQPAAAATATKADDGQTLRCTISGTPGDDVLRGTAGDDVICGGRGDDAIDGRGGDDILIGGAGDDVLKGGAGHDALRGGAGHDALHGGAGRDTLHGGAGRNTYHGGAGRDVHVRERGDKVLRSGGDDVVRSGPLRGILPIRFYMTTTGFPGGTNLRVEYLGGNCTKDELRLGPITLPGDLRNQEFRMFVATGGDPWASCTYERSHARFRATFAMSDGRTQQATFRIYQLMLGLPDYGVECETSTANCDLPRRTGSPNATFSPKG